MTTRFQQGAIGDRTNQQGWRSIVVVLGLLGLGMCVGELLPSAGTAWGQVQDAAPPEFFKSSSALSLPVLKDIATTLHQMDARLERLESVAKQLQQASRANQARN